MITWTEAANEAFEEHLAAIGPELLTQGLSPTQVASRLRIGINDVLASAGLAVAGRAEIVEAIAGLGPEFLKTHDQLAPLIPPVLGWWARIACVFLGVLVPLTALVVEAVTSMCAGMFDPIPTIWHMLAIAFVAFSNGWTTLLLVKAQLKDSAWLTGAIWSNAVAIGISAYYAIWFIPVTPFAVIGLIAFGLGLLPLSPLLAMITGLFVRQKLWKRVGVSTAGWPKMWIGALAGFVALFALEVPTVLTHWAATQVVRGTPDEQQTPLWLLRKFGSEDQLLRNCRWERYTDSYRTEVLRTLFGPCTMDAAQQVYFRVTGNSFNAVHSPGYRTRWRDFNRDEFKWDNHLGGEAVGERFEELRLQESRLDGALDGAGASGYLEWTMVFRNDNSVQQREARALIQLPPGAVVSRLTLWIDGEEREAAFGGRSQVRQAYQAVVQKRRDPVLVSYRGADRVLLQCFPVQPNGGEMKVRIGISLPLILDTGNEAKTGLPRIIEQNFADAADLTQAVWIEAKTKLTTTAADPRREQSAAGKLAVAFSCPAGKHDANPICVTVERDPSLVRVQAVDRRDRTRVVRQEIRRSAAGELLCIVLDGSQGMAAVAEDLAQALETLPSEKPVRLFLAGDVVRECPYRMAIQAADWVRRQEFVGGQDATDALVAASTVFSAQGGEILWIHGRQPMIRKSATALEQRAARSGATIRFLALAGTEGPNELVEKMASTGAVAVQPRLGTLPADIGRVLRRVQEGSIELHRELVAEKEMTEQRTTVSDHIVRLWAADEIKRLMHGRTSQQADAVRLAVAMQLVTPVSSAVVLEAQAQYDAAGLQPVDPDTVPSVPDVADTVWLLGIAIVGLLIFARYSKCRAIEQEVCKALGAGG